MNHKITAFAVILAVVGLFSSCLKGDDNTFTYYDDTEITSFSLGAVKCTRHTLTKDGKDSVYTYSYSASAYPFEIDQVNDVIFNIDSLLVGTRVDKVLASIYTKNNGYVQIKNLEDDSWTFYSTVDSIDFSQDRIFRVYSQDSQHKRDYTVKVNVHKEFADSFTWKAVETISREYLPQGVNAVVLNGQTYVFGADTTVYAAGGRMFSLIQGDLKESADGKAWNVVTGAPATLKTLVGCNAGELYAINDAAKLVKSVDNGMTWNEEPLEDGTYTNVDKKLPMTDVSFFTAKVSTNSDVTRLVMVGNVDATVTPNDTTAAVWTRLIDVKDASQSQPWTYTQFAWHNHYYVLPNMKSLSVVNYGDGLMAMGGKSDTKNQQNTPFGVVYYSPDCGTTWHTHNNIGLPKDYSADDVISAKLLSDDSNNIYLVAAKKVTDNGVDKTEVKIWRGKQNKQGWNNAQTQFK